MALRGNMKLMFVTNIQPARARGQWYKQICTKALEISDKWSVDRHNLILRCHGCRKLENVYEILAGVPDSVKTYIEFISEEAEYDDDVGTHMFYVFSGEELISEGRAKSPFVV